MTRSSARVTGVVYLAYFVTAIAGGLLTGRVSVAYADTVNLVANAGYVVVALLLARIFRAVSRNVSAAAVAIGIAGCIVQSLIVFELVPARTSLPIFGCFNLVVGYLILRSTFMPRALGMLMAVSGAAWLTFLVPQLPKAIALPIELLGIVAEAALMLRLLIAGVDAARWNRQAAGTMR